MPRLRAATFNLLHGVSLRTGRCEEQDLAAAAAALDADVVGLQEVDRGQPRSGGIDQTATVATALGARASLFVPTVAGTPGTPGWRPAAAAEASGSGSRGAGRRSAGRTGAEPRPAAPGPGGGGTPAWGGGTPEYGIGLVSRWPVREWQVLRMAGARFAMPLLVPGASRPQVRRVPDEPRAALLAVLEPDGGSPITVVTAHLSFVPGVNAAQLRSVTRWAAAFPAPRLLLGDFNLPGRLPARISRWHQLGRARTYPSYRPRVQLDHALASGADAAGLRRVRALPLPVSDHCALVVDLDL